MPRGRSRTAPPKKTKKIRQHVPIVMANAYHIRESDDVAVSIHRMLHRTGKSFSKKAVRKIGEEIIVADGLFTGGRRIPPNAWPTGPSRVLNKRMSRGMQLLNCDSDKSPGPSKYNVAGLPHAHCDRAWWLCAPPKS